jgi:hypothetical protein
VLRWLVHFQTARLVIDQPINLMYAIRRLRLRPEALSTKVVGIGPQPNRPTGFVLCARENGCWIRRTGPYAARAVRAAGRDAVLARQFLRVASLQDPPTRLFQPGIDLRVLRFGGRIAGSMIDAPRTLSAGRR